MLDGALILIELKRNKTPREVVAQAIDYATFVEGLESDRSDPAETQTNATLTPAREKEPWNGEVYASFGHDEKGRLWSEARQYGFISAGGGTWYSNSLNLLNPGDRIWVKAPGHGFVGVGRVKGKAVAASEFKLPSSAGEKAALEVLTGHYNSGEDDPDRAEYFVPVDWLETVPLEQAVQEIGMFGNRNTVCKPKTPKWRFTVDRLKQKFPNYNK